MRAVLVLAMVAGSACASSRNQPAASTGEQTVRVVGAGGLTQLSTTTTNRPSVVTVEMPAEQVWRALPAAYQSVGIELALTDSTRGLLGNPGFRARRRLGGTVLSRYLDCGHAQGAPSADTYEVHFSVLTEVQRQADGKTIVSTNVDASARPINFAGEPVRCLSRGELETRILDFVKAAGT
ncbi:MAG TPA: hypothetical protein VK928_06400 [Longimicrobiales bacterium]|nr:hypothetical protein [Longimicrobiales bacterium]